MQKPSQELCLLLKYLKMKPDQVVAQFDLQTKMFLIIYIVFLNKPTLVALYCQNIGPLK